MKERPRGAAGLFLGLTVNWLIICVFALGGGIGAAWPGTYVAEAYFFWRQDLPMLLAMIAATAGLAWLSRRLPANLPELRLPGPLVASALAGVCLLAGVLGAHFVFGGYTLSLDEFMANFDAKIFAHGDLLAPIAPRWQPLAPAMQPMFTLPVPDGDYWASAYLPINAAMRGLGRIVGAEWLVNPLLSAFSVLATWAIARRLWPARPEIAAIAAGLLGTSAQLLVMSMTAYAMPGHLAFNLAWLWLFLRGDRLGHAGAIAVAFLATGLHQLAFHPLFAAPFILQLWLDRRWALAGVYTLAYAGIGAAWVEFWPLELRFLGESPSDAASVGGAFLIDRAMDTLDHIGWRNLTAMGESLTRFVTWQSLLTAPLALAGFIPAFRAKGHVRALALGLFLTPAVMLVIEPTQVHGWGYRYMHGLLGSAALLGAWAWSRLTDRIAPQARKAAFDALAAACFVSLVAVAPVRAWEAWSYVRPYARADREIRTAPAKVVIVDHEGPQGFNPGTVVRNDPFLPSGQPKVMELSYMDAGMVRSVCADGGVLVFTGADAARAGIDTAASTPEPQVVTLRALMRRLHCGRPMPAPTSPPPSRRPSGS